MPASGLVARAAVMPLCRLAPSALCTSPEVPPIALPTAAASRWVVVVLPLVPETAAIRRPASSLLIACGSTLSITWPRIAVPVPRPARREAYDASRPASAAAANRARGTGAGGPGRRCAGSSWTIVSGNGMGPILTHPGGRHRPAAAGRAWPGPDGGRLGRLPVLGVARTTSRVPDGGS